MEKYSPSRNSLLELIVEWHYQTGIVFKEACEALCNELPLKNIIQRFPWSNTQRLYPSSDREICLYWRAETTILIPNGTLI